MNSENEPLDPTNYDAQNFWILFQNLLSGLTHALHWIGFEQNQNWIDIFNNKE